LPLFECLPLLLDFLELLVLDAFELLELPLLLGLEVPEVDTRLREEGLIVTLESLGRLGLLVVGLYRFVQLRHLSLKDTLHVI